MTVNPLASANLGFVSPMLPATKIITPGTKIQITVSATTYNHSCSGTPAFLTYEISKTGSFRRPSPVAK